MTSRVQTVLGDVSPSALGRTLTHEHLAMNFEHFYRNPPIPLIANKFTSQLDLQTIGYVRQYPYSSRYNLKLDDIPAEQAVRKDVMDYKTAGGGTIVENTTVGINRDISFYQNVSQASNVHIVAGTGHYIADLQSDDTLQKSSEDIYNHMLQELTNGCAEHPDTKAGFMGEIASVWPIRDFERRAIQATGELQPQVGCGVSFHPHRTKEAPFEIIRLYLEAGGSADKTVMSHLDRTLVEDEVLLEFAELGTYCQFDLFGVEVSYYQLDVATDMLSDAQRIQKISLLVKEGREDKVLMSHDIHTKHRLILTALNFYARGSYQGSVGQNMDGPMAQQTVSRCLQEVTTALNAPHIIRKYIKFPQNRNERNHIKQGFYEKYRLPGVIGCIDCSHIAIVRPSEHEEQYFNRKHFHSLNTQVTSFGGHGYAHIINNVLPKMKAKGFSQQQIDKITIENPARWLAIDNKSA